jgi:putative colanic acid biosysnthesis UDP-glucose lipid carrier transferase
VFGKSIFKNYSGIFSLLSRILDPLMVVVAAYCAYFARFSSTQLLIHTDYVTLVVIAFLGVVSVFPQFNLYVSWRGQSLVKQAQTIFIAWAVVVLMLIIILFSLKMSADYSRAWLLYWAIFGLVLMLLMRVLVYAFLQYQRKQGRNIRYVALVGAGDLAKKVLTQTKESPWTGYRIVALFDDNPELSGKVICDVPVKGVIADVSNYLTTRVIDEIWLALPLRAEQRMKQLLFDLRHFTVNIKLIPDIFGFSLLNHSMTEIAGLPAVNLSDTPMGGVNRLIKAVEDGLLGLAIFIFILPLLLLISIGIKLTSPGPVLFKQKRHGWDGKIINVYKFRTMRLDADENGSVTQAKINDFRVTPFGEFLRKTSLDELPQFYNVLQGRMSIVGPRPHAVQHNEIYKDQVDKYMLRHMVKPGITGWAQINGYRGETDTLDKMKRRIEFDLYYIENWSLWFDFKIIVMTIFKGFIHKNAY